MSHLHVLCGDLSFIMIHCTRTKPGTNGCLDINSWHPGQHSRNQSFFDCAITESQGGVEKGSKPNTSPLRYWCWFLHVMDHWDIQLSCYFIRDRQAFIQYRCWVNDAVASIKWQIICQERNQKTIYRMEISFKALTVIANYWSYIKSDFKTVTLKGV